MAQEQVGNASLEEAPESDYQALDDIASGDFFESLDTSVNSGIIDSEYSQSTSQDLGDNTPASPSGVQEQGEDALQKRYSDSSREAKRLNGKLQELEPYMPILDAMRDLRPEWAEKLGEDHTVDLTTLGEISETSLTKDMEIQMLDEGLPNTFVPGRNLLFVTFAAALAYRRRIRHLVTGVCETDYSGYPDCRDDAMKAMQLALNLGMDSRFVIHTPLMWIDKAETWALTEDLGGKELVELEKEHTHT